MVWWSHKGGRCSAHELASRKYVRPVHITTRRTKEPITKIALERVGRVLVEAFGGKSTSECHREKQGMIEQRCVEVCWRHVRLGGPPRTQAGSRDVSTRRRKEQPLLEECA
jgi:hypothetical protein